MAAGLAGVLTGAAGWLVSSDRPAGSAKKGVGTWPSPGVREGLTQLGVTWYYTWSAAPTAGVVPGVEFVPMIWGADSVTDPELDRAAAAGRSLLGFNEPDRADQANMTIAQALGLWPRLMATGRRLGSPAPAGDAATPDSWLDLFMKEARILAYRVDFITLHWYGTEFHDPAAATRHLESYLDAVHRRYGLPIWLTEYGLASYDALHPIPETAQYPDPKHQSAFVAASTSMLDALPYVERYAWFALPTFGPGVSSGLLRPDLTLTPVGEAYRAAG